MLSRGGAERGCVAVRLTPATHPRLLAGLTECVLSNEDSTVGLVVARTFSSCAKFVTGQGLAAAKMRSAREPLP